MKTIIKLLIGALLLNAAAQVGLAEFRYFNFEDAVHEVLLIPRATDEEIVGHIRDLAEDADIPLEPAKIQITRTPSEVKVSLSYDEDVQLVPGVYTKTWTFTPSTSARVLSGVGIPQKPPRPR